MNLRYKSAWIHYRVGGHETKCRFPALESLVLHFRNGGFHHTGIDGFHDRTGGVKPSGILNPLNPIRRAIKSEWRSHSESNICLFHRQKTTFEMVSDPYLILRFAKIKRVKRLIVFILF